MNYSDLRPNKKNYAHPVLLRSHFRDKNLKPFYACIIMGKLGHNGRAPVALVYWLLQRLSGILFDIASDYYDATGYLAHPTNVHQLGI